MMVPEASRVVRADGRWWRRRWSAEVLVPSGPWFWVGWYWTRRGALREVDKFVRRGGRRR